VIRGLGAVVYKELRQLRRDPASLGLALAIPVIQLTIFGFAIDTEVRDIPLVVVDRAQVRESRALTRAFQATGTFRLVGHVASRDEALARMGASHARAVLVFPPDYGSRLLAQRALPAIDVSSVDVATARDVPLRRARVQVLVDGSDSNVANQARAAALGVAETRAPAPLSGVEARVRFLYNPGGRSENFFVPGLAGIILQLVTMTLTASAIVRERERGTLEQLMVTPLPRLAVTLGKLLPPLLLAAAAAGLVLGLMVWLFDVPVRGSLTLLLALTVLFVFTSLALGLLVSTVARSQLQALMLTLLILLPSVLLSGFVFPRATMPTPIYELTFAIPATYFVEIMRGIVLRAAGARELGHMILPLAGIGVGVCALVAVRFRKTVG